MEKRLFIAEAHDLISLIEDSLFGDKNDELPISVEEITNYWVNDFLTISNRLPVKTLRRYLDPVETHCTLTAQEMKLFREILFHTIENFDFTYNLGMPTMHHRIKDGMIEFYILRG